MLSPVLTGLIRPPSSRIAKSSLVFRSLPTLYPPSTLETELTNARRMSSSPIVEEVRRDKAETEGAKCVPCNASIQPLSEQSVQDELLKLDQGWVLKSQPITTQAEAEGGGGERGEGEKGVKALQKIYRFRNFVNAMSFSERVGKESERQGHHPALLLEWGKVTVWWWSHSIKGLHPNDFLMANKTDEIARVSEGYKPGKKRET